MLSHLQPPHATSVVLFDTGKCFAMGSNRLGELGHGSAKPKDTPLPIKTPVIATHELKSLCCGDGLALAVGKCSKQCACTVKPAREALDKARQSAPQHDPQPLPQRFTALLVWGAGVPGRFRQPSDTSASPRSPRRHVMDRRRSRRRCSNCPKLPA